MRLTVQDFCQHSTNTLSVMKAKYKLRRNFLNARSILQWEKREYFLHPRFLRFSKSKEVVDISVINLENIKLWRFLSAKRIDDCMCTLLCCPQGVFVDAKFLRRWPF